MKNLKNIEKCKITWKQSPMFGCWHVTSYMLHNGVRQYRIHINNNGYYIHQKKEKVYLPLLYSPEEYADDSDNFIWGDGMGIARGSSKEDIKEEPILGVIFKIYDYTHGSGLNYKYKWYKTEHKLILTTYYYIDPDESMPEVTPLQMVFDLDGELEMFWIPEAFDEKHYVSDYLFDTFNNAVNRSGNILDTHK